MVLLAGYWLVEIKFYWHTGINVIVIVVVVVVHICICTLYTFTQLLTRLRSYDRPYGLESQHTHCLILSTLLFVNCRQVPLPMSGSPFLDAAPYQTLTGRKQNIPTEQALLLLEKQAANATSPQRFFQTDSGSPCRHVYPGPI